jgi:hypothetical protein
MVQINSAPIESSTIRLLSREEAEREDCVFWHSKDLADLDYLP